MTDSPLHRPDPALAAKVAEALQRNKNFMTYTAAGEWQVPEGWIIAALPEECRVAVPASEAKELWETMTGWEKVTFLACTSGMILEVAGRLPKGSTGHGMYNLNHGAGCVGGHVLFHAVQAVWLVSLPMFGMESHSVQFYDKGGRQCFAVYLGRGEDKQIIPALKAEFEALRQKYLPR